MPTLPPDNCPMIDLTATLPSLRASLTPGASGYNAAPVRFRNPVAKRAANHMLIAGLVFFVTFSCIIGYALACWR